MTGGGSGIGKSIAIRLAAEGCKIAIVDIENAAAIRTAEELSRLNVESRAYCVRSVRNSSISSFDHEIK